MESIRDCFETVTYTMNTAIFRVSLMFAITTIMGVVEIIYGIRAHSNSLIADGLYSFAEGLCLIGVLIILRYSHSERYVQKSNTFGYERLELLFGLMQEVFLLSVSLGIIVDAMNHLFHPESIHDPKLMIYLGGAGAIVGLLGMLMFRSYHHDYNIEEEISELRKSDFAEEVKENIESKPELPAISSDKITAETPLMPDQSETEADNHSEHSVKVEIKPQTVQIQMNALEAFTYENVEIEESKVYATLHALCLHSVVVLFESIIVVSSGLMNKFVPHTDPTTGKPINGWLHYIDPALTLIMVIIIAVRAVPVIFSIGEILIESVPKAIDTQKLMNEIITAVPKIKSIHSLHIWRGTVKEIYATLHLVCDEDTMLSTCTTKYIRDIQKILKSYCIRYFTLQFEYTALDNSGQKPEYRCVHGLHRKRRGHTIMSPK